MTIPVVILCGGQGTRLSEETGSRPKPMVEIGNAPILWHIMKIYSSFDFNDFVLCLGYKGDVIRQYFLQYDILRNDFTVELGTRKITRHSSFHGEQNWSVTLAETGALTQTGGRIKRIAAYIDGDTFMATYGDGVANLDINDLLRFHREHGRIATVTGVRPVARFGELTLSGDRAVKFHEKPQLMEGWINGGFFVFERRIFDYIDGDETILEQEPLSRIAAEGELAVYRHEDYWRCMDTLRDVEALNREWHSGAPWAIWRETAPEVL
jgi:glucose-1-phosphate cytidylyltransferase